MLMWYNGPQVYKSWKQNLMHSAYTLTRLMVLVSITCTSSLQEFSVFYPQGIYIYIYGKEKVSKKNFNFQKSTLFFVLWWYAAYKVDMRMAVIGTGTWRGSSSSTPTWEDQAILHYWPCHYRTLYAYIHMYLHIYIYIYIYNLGGPVHWGA